MNNSFIVQFDCTDRLERVLLSLADGLRGINKGTIVAQHDAPALTAELLNTPPEKPARKRKAKEQPKVEEPPQEVTEEPTVAEEPVVEKAPESDLPFDEPEPVVETPKKDITDQEIRAAIAECRTRLGADNDPNMKRTINDILRKEVSRLGYEASTSLPQELRPQFIEYCKTVEYDAPF